MLLASYIRRQHVKFMVRLTLQFNTCSLCVILKCRYIRYWYVTSSLNQPIANKSSGAIKVISHVIRVISGAITLTIRFSGYVTGNFHLLQRFGTKSDGAVKLIYDV